MALDQGSEPGVGSAVAALESRGTTVDFGAERVDESVGQSRASVVVFEEGAKILAKESDDADSTGWALVEMSLALRMHFARAASDGLGGIDLLEDRAHGKDLVNELRDEFFPGMAQFLDRAVVCFPID